MLKLVSDCVNPTGNTNVISDYYFLTNMFKNFCWYVQAQLVILGLDGNTVKAINPGLFFIDASSRTSSCVCKKDPIKSCSILTLR